MQKAYSCKKSPIPLPCGWPLWGLHSSLTTKGQIIPANRQQVKQLSIPPVPFERVLEGKELWTRVLYVVELADMGEGMAVGDNAS